MNGFFSGVSVAASLEFRQRIRAGKWRWLLIGWFALVGVITLLLWLAFKNAESGGINMFAFLIFFVLSLLVLVTPSLSAQSVNGDRERGTLATLQVTRLSASEIALGKFFSAWLTGLVFLALIIPMVVVCMLTGGVPIVNVFAVFLTMSLMLGVVCAISLAMSSLFKRSTTSTVMSYMAVFGLSVVTLVVFGLLSLFVRTTENVSQCGYSDYSSDGGVIAPCQDHKMPMTKSRPDLVWWVLAPNPFVIVADASPALPEKVTVDGDMQTSSSNNNVLTSISSGVRGLRVNPFDQYSNGMANDEGGPVWPWGLSFDVLLAIGALVVTTKRLRAPVAKLPRGQRVA